MINKEKRLKRKIYKLSNQLHNARLQYMNLQMKKMDSRYPVHPEDKTYEGQILKSRKFRQPYLRTQLEPTDRTLKRILD